MAKSFYLLDRKREREYKAFETWWADRIDQLKNDITSYCKETNGTLVNEDLAEDVISSDHFPKYFPVYDTSYYRRIGQLGNSSIYRWDSAQYWAYDYDYSDSNSFYNNRDGREMSILEKILNKNPECIVIDENNYPVDLTDFKLMCKSGYYKDPADDR